MLHLMKQQPLSLFNQQNDYTSHNQSSNLYSSTHNSFSRSVAMTTTSKRSKQTHTKTGDVTLYGLHKGYIQASPYYPSTKLSLEYSPTKGCLIVYGYNSKGVHIARTFQKITHARAYLKSII